MDFPTVYMWGGFMQQVTDSFIEQSRRQCPSWYNARKLAQLRSLVGKGYWAWDYVAHSNASWLDIIRQQMIT